MKSMQEEALQESQESPSSSLSCSLSSTSSLSEAIDDVTSLIHLSHVIKVFTGKWVFIRNKLEELKSGLIAIESCSSQNPILAGLVSAIRATVNECNKLAERCLDLSYSGKLQMKSDLDVVASRFDWHVKNLSGICTSGVLTHSFAIVVSKPAANASKDDLRFFVKDLLIRMKIGDIDMKRQSLISLHDGISEDERYVKVVFEMEDIVNIIITVLEYDEMEIQEVAAKIVSLLSEFSSHKPVLIGGGVICPLVRVLESGSKLSKQAAARSLVKLTENSDNAWSVSAHGGVTALLNICTSNDPLPALVCPACSVLKNVVTVEEIKRFMVEGGVISTFIKLMCSKDEAVQVSSIEFLQSIVYGDESTRQLLIKEGGIQALIRSLDPKYQSSSKFKEIALRAVDTLCFSPPICIEELLHNGFIHQLLFFLRKENVWVQETAMKLAFRLSGSTEEVKKAMGEAGFMTEFVKFLDAKSYVVREMAAEGLCFLVSLPRNRRKFVQDNRNIGHLLQLLDSEDPSPGNKHFLLSVLLSLTSCNSGRKKIASSGYVKNIEKLADAEVSDAKRLVKKLHSNRFLSYLGGIWN